jgi:catechol 2,3-dioxygenase-like lactoylglutathione lyase family enzyme
MGTSVGSCCIRVTDREATVAFYEALGLSCTGRHEVDDALVATIARPGKGGSLQVGQPRSPGDGFDLGTALWKLYVDTNDIEGLHADALAQGAEEVMAPVRLEQWPTSVSFVKDPDGVLVELVQRHPWLDGDDTTRSWVGQSCINVSDLDRAVAFWELLGLSCTSRTSISGAEEAIVENPDVGGKLQLARHDEGGPIAFGDAMWKLYLTVDDAAALHDAAVAAGHRSFAAPKRVDEWNVTVALVRDPDGYLVELVQRHPC